MQIKGFCLSLILFTILICGFGSAAFIVDSNTSIVKKDYNIGDKLSGSLSISFNNQSSVSILSTNLGNDKIKLIDWLKQAGKKERTDYNCSFAGCASNYQLKSEITNTDISPTQPKNIGFKISGSNITVKNIGFTASTSLPNSCSKQFSITVADKENKILQNYRYTEELCDNPISGCFDKQLTDDKYQLANLTKSPYCERMNLKPSPSYSFTANITKPSGAKYEEVAFDLYSGDYTIFYGSCILAAGANRCIVNYTITSQGTYGICVSSNETNSAYQIRTEQSDQICGSANLGQTMSRDFDIYAQALTYASVPIVFDNDKYAMLNNEENITDAVNEYLKKEYNSTCINADCFIPFRIIGENQRITFSNVMLNYESDGVMITQNKIYEINKTPSSISSGKIMISLDAAQLNVSTKNSLLQLSLDNESAFRTNAVVSNVPITVDPTFALIGIPTEFKIKSNYTVLNATWKFSDDLSTFMGIKARHTFSKSGTYTLNVTALTSWGTFSKTVEILVGEPAASAEELIVATQARINALSNSLKTIPTWIMPGINSKINIVALNNSLATIKEKLAYATTDAEYLQIITEIQNLAAPQTVGITRSGTFPIITTYGDMKMSYLNSLYNQEQINEDQMKASILEWVRDSYDGQIELSTYGAGDSNGNSPILTKVKISLTPKTESTSQKYLVIDYPIESLHFLAGYAEKELQSGTYIPIVGASTIEFYTDGEVTIGGLGLYLAPALSELQKEGYSYEVLPSAKGKVRMIIYISLAILLLVVILVTFGLQHWYRNNYERHLFPKEESLFNVMTFIYNSKKNDLREGDIRKNLLSNGWRREQISYALGKFEGKIFGIFGVPIYSAREEQKMRQAIENRQRQNTSRKVY